MTVKYKKKAITHDVKHIHTGKTTAGSTRPKKTVTIRTEEWNERLKMRMPKIHHRLMDMRLHRSSDSCIQC